MIASKIDTGTAVCGEHVRGDGACELDAGHRGYHSGVAYVCDACSKRRRGQPYSHAPDGEYARGLGFCFLCTLADMERYPAGL